MSRKKPPNNLTRRKLGRDQNLDQNQLSRGMFFYQTFIPSSIKYKQWNKFIQIATTLHTLGFTVGSNDGVERHSYHHYHEFHEIPSCYEQTRPAQNNESASDTESESDQDTDTDTDNDTDQIERDEETAALTDTDKSDTDGTDGEESESDHSESESDRRETILREIAELESELEAIDGIGNTDDTDDEQ